ncbi:hypothetical protein CEXT_341801 [Caerostris extrusa]|uniref:Uncharacterized protein n=1 Tax=Caerostris extrusa TaxID=172846 RepID=A0AAV4QUG3_CAEEX|nr:hypothetical protein CEXT_341801 [Caerostris extrusa]
MLSNWPDLRKQANDAPVSHQIANSLNAEEIFKTDSLGTKISIERFHGSNTAPQCRIIVAKSCHLKPKCAHCTSRTPHRRLHSSLKIRAKICANCNGSHVAYWRGCPQFPKERTPATQKETRVYS